MSDHLEERLKKMIVETLALEDVEPESIETEAPLFGEGLGLDSIDALELAVAIERRYRVTIPDEAVGKKVFSSVSALAAYVAENKAA
jgi:acyl carrier protein